MKEETGAHVEFLMLTQKENDVWEVITGPGRRAKVGSRFVFRNGILKAEIIDVLENGNRLAKFTYEGNNIFNVLEKVGEMPLPHYITEKLEDNDRYQTVYATRKTIAQITCKAFDFERNLFVRYCGIVIESLATIEKRRSLGASTIQLIM